MERQGQPFEVAPTFVYLASDDSLFLTGQTLHVNGGQITSITDVQTATLEVSG